MKRVLLVFLVATSVPAMAADTGTSTASAMSAFTLSGVKWAMRKNAQVSPQQKLCIEAIPDDALAEAYLPLASRRLDGARLASFDSFFSSTLGKRYLKAFSLSPPTAGYGAESFTQSETSIIRKTMNDQAFMAFATEANVENPGAPQDKLVSLLQACGWGKPG